MEWTLLAAGTESVHHNTVLEAGGRGVLGKILLLPRPRTPWDVSLGMLHRRGAGAPAAWSCWGAVGTGPGLPTHPRAQLHAGLPHLTTLLCGGSLLADNCPSALPPASVPWAVLRILWGPWSFLHNHLSPHCLGAAGMEPAPAQCLAHQESSWLIAISQTRSLGHPQHPLHCLMGRIWSSHRAAGCWAGQGLCGLN